MTSPVQQVRIPFIKQFSSMLLDRPRRINCWISVSNRKRKLAHTRIVCMDICAHNSVV